MKSLGSRFEDCVDVPASVSALAGIVKRSLYLEFTHHVGIGKRHVRGLGYVVIGRTDALDQIVVIVLALPVHNDAHIASPQLGGGVQFTLRPGGERQQLLKILRRQRQATNCIRLNRLSRGGGAGINSLDGCLHFNLLLHRDRPQPGFHARDFRNTHHNTGDAGFLKTGTAHADGVGAHRQQGCRERTIGIGLYRTRHRSRILINNAHIRAYHHRAARILHRAGDRARGAALGKSLPRKGKRQRNENCQPNSS